MEAMFLVLASDRGEPMNIDNAGKLISRNWSEHMIEMTGSSSVIAVLPLPKAAPPMRRPNVSMDRSVLGGAPTVDVSAGRERTTLSVERRLCERGAMAGAL